jgi:hypothetical protein
MKGGRGAVRPWAATPVLPQSLNAGSLPTHDRTVRSTIEVRGLVLYLNVTERFGQGREHMKSTSLLSIALAMGLSIAALTSPASAAVRDASAGRDAVVAKCMTQARGHYPGNYRDWGQSREFAYQSCMHDAGQAM